MTYKQKMNQSQVTTSYTLSDPVLLSDERHKGKLSHLSVKLWNMLKQKQACDIKIKTCDVDVNAHSCILIATSEYFRKCFDLISRKRGTAGISGVIIDVRRQLGPGLNYKDMMNILHYIYTGDIEVTLDNCIFLFKASRILELEYLTELMIPLYVKICSLQISDLSAKEKQYLHNKTNYKKHEAADTNKSESQTLPAKGVGNNPEEEHISLETGNILPEHDIDKESMGGETSNDINKDSFEEKEPQMETENSHLMNLECDEDDADASQQDSPINSENLDALGEVKLEPNEMDLNCDELISNDANERNPNDDELIINQGAHLENDQGNVNPELNSNDEPNSNENRVSSIDESVHTTEELTDAIKDKIYYDNETTKDASSATITSSLQNRDNENDSGTSQCVELEMKNKTIIPVYIDHPYSSVLNITHSFEGGAHYSKTENSHLMNLECDEDDADASEQDSPINSGNLDALDEVKLEPNEMDLNSVELISNANEGNPNDDELIINGGANLEYDQWNVNGEINSNDEPNSNENRVNSIDESVHTTKELTDAIKDEIYYDNETTKDASSATITSNLLNRDNENDSGTSQCVELEMEDKTIIQVYIDRPYSSFLNTDMVNHFQDVPNVNIQKMNEFKDGEDGTNIHRDDIHEETLLNDQERYLDLYQEKCQYAVTHSPFNIPSFGGDYMKPWPVELANITSVVENEINIGYNETCAESKEVITGDNETDNNDTKIHNPSKQVPVLYGSVEEVSKINGDAPVIIKRSCRVKCKRLNDQSGERKKIKCMPRQIQIFEITQRGIRCPNCTRRFKNELKLLNHFITCWTGKRVKDVIKRNAASNLAQDNYSYRCDNCTMPFYLNYKRFLRHCYFCYQTNDKEELVIVSIPCYKCNKFVSEEHWMKHLQKCLLPSFDEIPAIRSPGGLHCHICTYKINYREKVRRRPSESNQRLASHMYHKHGIVQSGFRLLKCAEEYKKEPNCTYATVGKKYLNSHIKIKHKQDHIIGPEFQCGVLESGIKKQKFPKLTLQCEECGQMYCSKAAVEDCLEAHRRSEPVPCRVPSCMKTFLTKRREKWHYKKTHDEGAAEKRRTKLVSNVPNICQACGKDFRERCRLVQHESKVHKIPLPKGYHRYQCNRCSFWDISRCIVRFHKLRHEKLGIKQYLCEVCGKKFTSFFQKEIHYRTYHKGKGYKCEHCDKLLPRKDSLILHTRIMHTHKNIKKYQCHLCEYCSNIMGNLRLHLRNKHKLTVATHSKGSSVSSEQLKEAVIVTKEGSVVPYVPELLEDL